MLYELGYSNISEYPKEYRTRPIYRESDNNTVLRIDKSTGGFVDFAENISGSFEDLVKLTLRMKSIDEAQKWFANLENILNEKENKIAEIKLHGPGSEFFAKRQCKTFEEATDQAAEALRRQIQKNKR